ncbi:hypothetical protein [Paenibacillus antri]|nr:hypothetical protein [Paenibacillus antri]
MTKEKRSKEEKKAAKADKKLNKGNARDTRELEGGKEQPREEHTEQ